MNFLSFITQHWLSSATSRPHQIYTGGSVVGEVWVFTQTYCEISTISPLILQVGQRVRNLVSIFDTTRARVFQNGARYLKSKIKWMSSDGMLYHVLSKFKGKVRFTHGHPWEPSGDFGTIKYWTAKMCTPYRQ